MTRSAFAGRVGLDRSTLSQLLSPGNERLPRAETIVAIARESPYGVDWLLGLSQDARPQAQLVDRALEIEPGAGFPMDDRLESWHREAVGTKIRYVPTTLPDLLKSPEVIRHEFQDYGALVPQARIESAEARLEYSRRPETDMEVCGSWQTLELLAYGQGVWKDLSLPERRRQLELMCELLDELYPTFRWFLYDGLRRFSVPYTIFGPKRAVIYCGNMYMVFNAVEQIRALTRHFDDLIRAAKFQPLEVITFIEGLLRDMPRRTDRVAVCKPDEAEGS